MKLRNKLALTLLLLLGGALAGRSQEMERVRFNPDYSFRDVRVGYGRLFMMEGGKWDASLVEGHYTAMFWQHLAYRVGAQFSPDLPGYGSLIGLPAALVYRPGTMSMQESLIYAAERSIYDAAWSGIYWGSLDGVGGSVLLNFLTALFRRTEYFVGLTPAYLGGNRFLLTLDAGLVLTIPIGRIGLNVSPTYHRTLTRSFFDDQGNPCRNLFSITGGISYLF